MVSGRIIRTPFPIHSARSLLRSTPSTRASSSRVFTPKASSATPRTAKTRLPWAR